MSSDYKVEIVDSSGDADMSVTVVGDQVVDLTGATDGQVLTVGSDGTVAPENPAAASGAAGGVLSGTYPNPGFAADMATQAELDAKVVDSIADGDTSHAPSANAVFDALASKVSASLYDAESVVVAIVDNTPVVLPMPAGTVLARLLSGDIIAATVAQMRTLLGLDGGIEPLFKLASGNWATGTNYTPGQSTALVSGTLRGRYFTARSAIPIGSVATYCQAAASVGVVTLARVGIWSLGANGIDLAALVASTANDIALWNATGKITKALQASWTPVVGQRYFVGVLDVATGTLPSLTMVSSLVTSVIPIEGNGSNATLAGQTDLPAASAAMVTTSAGPYVELIPA